jgi:hypothetical protein
VPRHRVSPTKHRRRARGDSGWPSDRSETVADLTARRRTFSTGDDARGSFTWRGPATYALEVRSQILATSASSGRRRRPAPYRVSATTTSSSRSSAHTSGWSPLSAPWWATLYRLARSRGLPADASSAFHPRSGDATAEILVAANGCVGRGDTGTLLIARCRPERASRLFAADQSRLPRAARLRCPWPTTPPAIAPIRAQATMATMRGNESL